MELRLKIPHYSFRIAGANLRISRQAIWSYRLLRRFRKTIKTVYCTSRNLSGGLLKIITYAINPNYLSVLLTLGLRQLLRQPIPPP